MSSCDVCTSLPSADVSSEDGTRSYSMKSFTDPAVVADFLSGRPPFAVPIKNSKVTSVLRDNEVEFYVFYSE